MRIEVDRATVEGAIESFLDAPGDVAPETLQGAKRFGLLPIWADFGGCIALRPDGELLFWAWDEPEKLETISNLLPDRQMVHAARATGSKRFPAIPGLEPMRTPDSQVCPSCRGAGRLPGTPDKLVCECGGLGWVPDWNAAA